MKNTLKTLGATNLAVDKDRARNDYYGTDPRSTKALLAVEKFDTNILEPCAGHMLIANVLKDAGYNVFTTDLVDYGYGVDKVGDFLQNEAIWEGDIITNPPYGLDTEFAIHAIEHVLPGHKVAMFLRTLFLEGQKKYTDLFSKYPPKVIYVFTNRQTSSKVDDFSVGSAVSYSWFVWERGYTGDPVIKWITSK